MKSYALRNCTLDVDVPVEVGRDVGHFWFATLHPIEGEDILCGVILSADEAQGEWPARLHLSRDSGRSWTAVEETARYGPISHRLGNRELLMMPYELWPLEPGDRRNARADGTLIRCGEDGGLSLERTPVKYLGLPRDLADYHTDEVFLHTNGNILPLSDGRLFATLYGQFHGEGKFSAFAVTSEDRGHTWHFRSVVASWEDLPEPGEGPNESNTVRLADGRLMCVYRVGRTVYPEGETTDFHKCYSADEGATWTKPERVNGAWTVEPQLERLENGLILLSGGRPGLFLWVCADGEGKQWERLNLAEHHNALIEDASLHYSEQFCRPERTDPPQSTSYTCMQRIGPDEVLISYDRLGNGWSGAPGRWGEKDVVFCVRVGGRRS